MILLKEILLLPTLYLGEVNSGYTDHILHKKISDKIYNGWLEIIESIEDKDVPLFNIPESKLDIVVNKIVNFKIQIVHDDISATMSIDVVLVISDTPYFIPFEKSTVAINIYPVKVLLVISNNFTVNQILSHKNEIENMAHHEAVHLIKLRQKTHQLSFKDDEFDNKDDDFWYKYCINSDEFHAYISRINNELKHIKSKHKNILLHDALNLSKNWKRYTKDVFTKSKKLRNKMLSKIANYWNKLK